MDRLPASPDHPLFAAARATFATALPQPAAGDAPIVLIVDDSPHNLAVLGALLQPTYRVRTANSGERALHLMAQAPRPELVLLDVMMPGIDGHEVLRHMQADAALRDVPVIFLTAMTTIEDERRGLELGAVDYITKPLRPPIVLARVRTHLALKRARDRLLGDKATLELEAQRRTREIEFGQDVTIHALARLAETRDNETGNHLLRTQDAVHHLAILASALPDFAGELDATVITLMAKSAPLHDIGKVGIPDYILLKPGPLTPEEWVIMRRHARLGAEALERAEADACEPLVFLRLAKQIALSHHERWDGSGYPEGLSGRAIPLAARIMAIADVFDALVCARVYKPAMPPLQAREIMAAERGRHFDPLLLDIFLDNFGAFCAIAHRYPDPVRADA